MTNREKIIEIYETVELPQKIRQYLKEEIDFFDSQGKEFWNRLDIEKIDSENKNNILIFYFLGLAKKPTEYRHNYLMNDPPDIDCDLESDGRDKVIEYLKEKYGKEKVLQIGTIGTTKIKSAIQDIARVMNIPPDEVYPVTTSLTNLDESATLEELKKEYPKLEEFFKKYKGIEEHLHKLLGVFSHYCLAGDSKINVSCFGSAEGMLLGSMCINELCRINKIPGSHPFLKPFLAYITKDKKIKYTYDYEVVCLGEDEMFEITLEDGRKIKCTEDHTWFTNQGLKQLKDFNEKTKILFIN